jgi:microcompartment protein CcmK/EutM
MNPSDVPVKTVAGNLEVSRRAHKLSSRVRSLLIVIHGTDTVAELTRNFHAFGDVGAGLNELAQLGLISVRGAAGRAATPVTQLPAANAADIVPPAMQAKQLLNESAVAVLGLRAFLFTLKLEHCYTAEELRGILPEYERVVTKAKGADFAGAILNRVQSILAQG